MNPLTSIKLAELHQHDLRVDAANARLAAEVRSRRRHSFADWRDRVTDRWGHLRTVTPTYLDEPTLWALEEPTGWVRSLR